MNVTDSVLINVNVRRHAASLMSMSAAKLQRLLDWRDEPRGYNVTKAGLRRFSQILGFEVKSNQDGGFVFLTGNKATKELAITIGCSFFDFQVASPAGPQGYLGPAILLSDEIVTLATNASREMRRAWYSGN